MSAATHHQHFSNFLGALIDASRPQSDVRVSVLSVPMPDQGPGVIGYQITGLSQADVQTEIDRVCRNAEAENGIACFRNPAKSREAAHFGKWQARGYTRIQPRGVA